MIHDSKKNQKIIASQRTWSGKLTPLFLLLYSSGKPSQDLLNLDFFGTSSSASTPTGTSYTLPSPISPKTEINWNLASAGPQTSRSSFPTSSPSSKYIVCLC